MKQVVKARVLPTDENAAALSDTLCARNQAAWWLSAQMHTSRAFRKIDAQHRFYTEVRERFGLAAQPAIRVIGKVADAYAALRANIAAGTYGPPGSDRRRKIEDSPIMFRLLGAAAVRRALLVLAVRRRHWRAHRDRIDLDRRRPVEEHSDHW